MLSSNVLATLHNTDRSYSFIKKTFAQLDIYCKAALTMGAASFLAFEAKKI